MLSYIVPFKTHEKDRGEKTCDFSNSLGTKMQFIVLEKGANPDYLPYKEKYKCQSCVWKHYQIVLIKERAIQLLITLL